MFLCLDFDSDRVNETEGEQLFTEPGKASEFLERVNKSIGDSISQFHTTKAFVEKLAEMELLSPQSLNIKMQGQKEFNLTGLYIIDEEKLNGLADDKYAELRKLGYIGPIYACMFANAQCSKPGQNESESRRSLTSFGLAPNRS